MTAMKMMCTRGKMKVSRAVFFLWIAGCGLSAPSHTQVEIRAEQRQRELSTIDVTEIPLVRHLFADQELAVWLPDDFVSEASSTRYMVTTSLSRDEDGTTLHFTRQKTPPGTSLIQIMEATLEGLRKADTLREIKSVRRMRLAARHAIEVTGTSAVDGHAGALRIILALDPGDTHYRMILMTKKGEKGEPIDVTFRRLIRDWSPLDASIWNPAFERLRGTLVAREPSLTWARRNRLFDAIAQPNAIGQSWVSERLAALAEPDPLLLVDGWLHHHPRVRIACVEALDPSSVAETARSRLFAIAARDPDPAVRLRVARRVARSPKLATKTLARVLDVDSDEARAAAFQLLATLTPSRRAELIQATFDQLRQYPEKSQIFLAALLAHWGPPGQADEALRRVWKTSRHNTLRHMALLALLEKGHGEALTAAWERLRKPLEPAPLELTTAARALAIHGPADQSKNLELLVASLEKTSDNARSPSLEKQLGKSQTLLQELLNHFESLSQGASEDECAILDRRSAASEWVLERQAVLACRPAKPAELVRMNLPRPGGFASSLLALLDRLQVGSTAQNEVFHAGIDRLSETLRHWAGDPISTTSTGLDLSAPLQLAWWPEKGGARAGKLSSSRSGSMLRARSNDFQQLLDSVARISTGPIDLHRLTTGLMAVHALPLTPIGLFAQWNDERALLAGEDSASSTSTPPKRYIGLTTESPSINTELATLHELELDEEKGGQWNLTYFSWREGRLTITRGEPEALNSEAEPPSPTSSGHESHLEVDLSGLLRHFKVEAAAGGADASDLIPAELTLSARTNVEGPSVTTGLELSGLAERWLATGANVSPAAMAAPIELLPLNCLAWLGFSLEPTALMRLFESSSDELDKALSKKFTTKLLAATKLFQGEAGLALIGVPGTESRSAAESWKRHVVVYFSVEPKAADRFLQRSARPRKKHGKTRFYQWGDAATARLGQFLVVASDPEILSTLGEGPRFAASPIHAEILASSPGDATVFGAFDTDLLADAVRESLADRRDENRSSTVVEILRSLGNIVTWFRREERSLVGELTISPRMQSEATQARLKQRSGYAGFVKGSISTDGLPASITTDPPHTELEFSLTLPPGAEDPGLTWSHERHDQERLESGKYHFTSRSGQPLPETSPLALPITGPTLVPYIRNEHNLNLHLEEVRELGEKIRGSETDPARIVRAIVRWAHESLEYSVIQGTSSVEEILATRQADCTEFTQLTIALARSLGIPARPVHGVHVGRHAAILHRWAEVFLDRWYEVDSTFGVVQVPARSIRIPTDDGRYLALTPGSRFTIHKALGAQGAWTRRLPSGAPMAANGTATIAVEGDRVLLTYPTTEDGDATGGRTLFSDDGGRGFVDLPATGLRGELVGMIAGHGRLLRLHRDRGETNASPAVLFQLSERREWLRIPLPDQIPNETGVITLGVHSDGFLVFVDGVEPRLFRVDAGFELATEMALPRPVGGEWLLAAQGGALVQKAPGEEIRVHLRRSGEWQPPLLLQGSENFAAREIRNMVGDRREIVAEHRENGRKILYLLDGDSQSKSSVNSASLGISSTTTGTGGETWIFWADDTGQFLTRR